MTITEEELQQKISLDTEIINIEGHISDILQREQTEDTKQQIESLKGLISDITKQYTLIYEKDI